MDWHNLLVVPVFFVMVTVLVAAHEFGHFLFAKMCGMEVEEFAIGFYKPAWVWMRKNGTIYTVRPIPAGGFVRIKGMVPQEDGGETQVPNGFYSKTPLQRLAVLFAGPLFSVLAGMVLLVALFTLVGRPVDKPIVGQVRADSPAARAGLQSGDQVLSVDGEPVKTWLQMQSLVRPHFNTPTTLQINHQGAVESIRIQPQKSDKPQPLFDSKGNSLNVKGYVGTIGVTEPVERMPVGQAVGESVVYPVTMVNDILGLFRKPAEFGQMMGGPGTIVVATSDATKEGPYQVVFLAALLSISLGIMNLLPVYPLDGGQMAVAFAELLRKGKRLSIEIQGAFNTIGFALVGILIISVLWVDFQRFAGPDKNAPPTVHSQPAKR